jgi:hypothetical protein
MQWGAQKWDYCLENLLLSDHASQELFQEEMDPARRIKDPKNSLCMAKPSQYALGNAISI